MTSLRRAVAAVPIPAPARKWASHVAPAIAFCALWLLLELPVIVRPDRFELTLMRPTLEWPLLLTLGAATFAVPGGKWVRTGLWVLAIALLIVRLDRVLVLYIMRTEPLLYDQLFMARHLFVLITDLWSLRVFLITVGAIVGITLLVMGVRRLLATATTGLVPERRRASIALLVVLWLCAGIDATRTESFAQWMTPALADNIERSVAMYQHVQSTISDSPYTAYDDIKLTRKPDVRLFFVESYGRLMYTKDELRKPWLTRMELFQQQLSAHGYHTASAWTTAPISGARSWLAEATLLTGMRVRYEAVFYHLAQQMAQTPNVVRLLDGQGYQTVLLAPADRRRPGVEEVNRYGWDRIVQFEDLSWHGPSIGWGIIPDQYSLGFTQENVLSKVDAPLFFNFHMVSSHAPWMEVPLVLDAWEDVENMTDLLRHVEKSEASYELLKRMRRYRRRTRNRYMGNLTGKKLRRYEAAVHYSLEVLSEHITSHEPDGLIIIMGDHQPPLVAPETLSFDVPIHLISKDKALLTQALEAGFEPGMPITGRDRRVMRHEGFFSLLARTLADCCSETEKLPEFRPRGSAAPDDVF